MNYVRSYKLSLKYQRFTPSGYKDLSLWQKLPWPIYKYIAKHFQRNEIFQLSTIRLQRFEFVGKLNSFDRYCGVYPWSKDIFEQLLCLFPTSFGICLLLSFLFFIQGVSKQTVVDTTHGSCFSKHSLFIFWT